MRVGKARRVRIRSPDYLNLEANLMTQKLVDLRASILERRYEDALAIVDELEGMSKKAILRAIKSFVVRMLIHLIKTKSSSV
jgi:hypothetical protein